MCCQASRYNIGGADYVLDDLENGILRGNSPAASTLGMLLKLPWLSKGPFKAGDPRVQHVSGFAALLGCSCSAREPRYVRVCRQHALRCAPNDPSDNKAPG
jgi:hypothetical protein